MKLLNGRELAEYIKERQAKQVRALRQAHSVKPKLAIVVTTDNPVINTYVRLKKRYGADILVEVDTHVVDQADIDATITQLNKDNSVSAIIVQLPLADTGDTRRVLDLVDPAKDVDGLSSNSDFDPATPTAILWLLSGYNVDLRGKQIAIVGKGPLVGAPLLRMLKASDFHVMAYDRSTNNFLAKMAEADVIISGAGQPGLITPSMVKQGAVVVDAGVAGAGGKTVGDVSEEVYGRNDLTITPQKGGVGPLTVCALFDNVIRAASKGVS